MFICDDCHDVECDHVHLFLNMGACESCKRVGSCYNCSFHKEHGDQKLKDKTNDA